MTFTDRFLIVFLLVACLISIALWMFVPEVDSEPGAPGIGGWQPFVAVWGSAALPACLDAWRRKKSD